MISSYARKMRSFAIAAAAVGCLTASGNLFAANSCSTPPCVTYMASGTFSTTVVKGTDTFKLAGQKFQIALNNIPESANPFKHGTGYAEYNKLNMTGTVNSGLDPTPVTLASSTASIELALESAKNSDLFALYVPVKVLGLTFDISASIIMPLNTIVAPLHPQPLASSVPLTSSTTTVVYSYTPAGGTPQSTTLTIATGTLSSTVNTTNPPAGGQTASLHADAPGMPDAVIPNATDAVLVRKLDLAA